VVPAGLRLSGRTSIALAELADERIVAPLETSPARPAFDDLVRHHGIEPRVVAEGATH
jgi:hypothetical protein